MKKMTVADLFGLPTMANSFLVAGSKGLKRPIERIDILETPFPDVAPFLETNEFMFTSFWNSKDSAEQRAQLVHTMVRKRCAGLAVMAGLYLNGKIDREILQIADKNDFPILSLPDECRWSDVIGEFYRAAHAEEPKPQPCDLLGLLQAVSAYRLHKSLPRLGGELSRLVGLPLVLLTPGESYCAPAPMREKALRKLSGVWLSRSQGKDTPFNVYIDDTASAECFLGGGCMVGALLSGGVGEGAKLALFQDLARFLCEMLEGEGGQTPKRRAGPQLSDAQQYYMIYMRGKNLAAKHEALAKECELYEWDSHLKYGVFLLPQQSTPKEALYQSIGKILALAQADLFIFSDIAYYPARLRGLVQSITGQLGGIYALNGIYTAGEIPLLYLLSLAPYALKKKLYDDWAPAIQYGEDALALDTLRLFVATKSLGKLAALLGVHVNTVKYRVQKAVNPHFFDASNLLNNVWSLELLLPLENAKLEEY